MDMHPCEKCKKPTPAVMWNPHDGGHCFRCQGRFAFKLFFVFIAVGIVVVWIAKWAA